MRGAADDRRGRSNVPKYLAVLAIALFGTAALAGIYTFGLAGSGERTTSSGTATTATGYTTSTSSACVTPPLLSDAKVDSTTFGAITEYSFPVNRTPGGLAVAPDGSVWVGEWGLPGVAHIGTDGTVTEYRWPYPDRSGGSDCGQVTNIWGVALWNGSVWGTDFFYSRLVGVDPATGQTQLIDLKNGTTPYTLAVTDGDLWFTASKLGAQIGKVSPTNGSVTYYDLPTGKTWETTYILFPDENATVGYVLDLNGVDYFQAQVYSFDPMLENPTFTAVGQNQTLYAPTGLTLGEGGLWATEHSASAMAFLNFTTGAWTIYPTSTVPYTPWVLTYFDGSNGTAVWFNEHYANRMGVIYDNSTQLMEYNVSNPPLYNITAITDPTNGTNMVTMAPAQDGAWFAAAGGFVGYVNGSYAPSFSIAAGASSVQVAPGGSSKLALSLAGVTAHNNLSLQFSDNENNSGTPQLLSFTTPSLVPSSGGGPDQATLTIGAASTIKPGTYIAAATVTNGSIYRSVYFTVVVT